MTCEQNMIDSWNAPFIHAANFVCKNTNRTANSQRQRNKNEREKNREKKRILGVPLNRLTIFINQIEAALINPDQKPSQWRLMSRTAHIISPNESAYECACSTDISSTSQHLSPTPNRVEFESFGKNQSKTISCVCEWINWWCQFFFISKVLHTLNWERFTIHQ